MFLLFHAEHATACHFPILHLFEDVGHPHCPDHAGEAICTCNTRFLVKHKDRVYIQRPGKTIPIQFLYALSRQVLHQTHYFGYPDIDFFECVCDPNILVIRRKNAHRAPPFIL